MIINYCGKNYLGTPTREPDVILQGEGFRIGYGESDYR